MKKRLSKAFPHDSGEGGSEGDGRGLTSAQELSLNPVKLEMIECIILFILSSQGARKSVRLVRTQVATLFRHSPFYSDNLYFNSGNLLHLKFNASAECHLPPNHGGRLG